MKGNEAKKNKNPLNNNHIVTSSIYERKSFTKKYTHFGTYATLLVVSCELRWEKDTHWQIISISDCLLYVCMRFKVNENALYYFSFFFPSDFAWRDSHNARRYSMQNKPFGRQKYTEEIDNIGLANKCYLLTDLIRIMNWFQNGINTIYWP